MDKRWRFKSDDSGHWYCIPANMEEDFNLWVEHSEYPFYMGPTFDKYRASRNISGYTFTDPKED